MAKKETSEEYLDRIRREFADCKKICARERIVTVVEEPEAPDPFLFEVSRPNPREKPPEM